MLGNAWQGILPSFSDESYYYAHVHTIGEGYLTDGSPFFFEHRNGPPIVIFGGAWLNALPLWAGISFNATMLLNFIVWSIAFAVLLYWLFREWALSRWLSVSGTVLIYLQSYYHVWRTVNLQTVYPFYFLFYIALARFIREQNRKTIGMLAAVVAISFYMFAYLWQIAVITLGLLFLYALARKNWRLAKATLLASAIGGAIGLPVPLYMLVWLPHISPYFWESIYRFGLVYTRIPMAEVIYSGGWIGIILAFLLFLYWRSKELRADSDCARLGLFLAVSGLGLWIMQGSNVITNQLLETGEHVKLLILPWLAFATILVGVFLFKRRSALTTGLRILSLTVVSACALASIYFAWQHALPFITIQASRETWLTEQTYARPFAWLNQAEKEPVVVWSDPATETASLLPVFTKHFVLYSANGMGQLVSGDEIRERFLVSQYFDNPTLADLESDRDSVLYLGRRDFYHHAATIAREVKVCRLLFFWDPKKDCGTIPTSQELLGDAFFASLEKKFQSDVRPNIRAYLKKYHVSYILKDIALNPQYHPEQLGAYKVYSDEHFELYKLPQ